MTKNKTKYGQLEGDYELNNPNQAALLCEALTKELQENLGFRYEGQTLGGGFNKNDYINHRFTRGKESLEGYVIIDLQQRFVPKRPTYELSKELGVSINYSLKGISFKGAHKKCVELVERLDLIEESIKRGK